MNILILGSGGREHAFALKIAQSKLSDKLYVAPGNSGTHNIAKNISININDFKEVKKTVLDLNIGMLIVGPEDPLVNGIARLFSCRRQRIKFSIMLIGPSKANGRHYWKGSKERCQRVFDAIINIPTAAYATFHQTKL